ncbi:hypothetical protein J0X19_20985 [Hymenobacter sp. BT186]|uniref:Uncharacterized protein n=1 Tax=Hymenobacter telluris TaxID=2816474 RepID=A0A939EZP1_9BACT|nr:hypothetical protein [Hymenobacter telluris]MBO0360450.1 hypothetical protein [Hymenobacter telluris]MBW3376477.1 hypothetical protein [Hymenobacter norwichensis]
MLTAIPNPDDYKNVGIECLVQAYKSIFSVDNGEMRHGVERGQIWKYNEIVLRTSIVLIHQGIELLLKSEVAKKSPLLLIDQRRGEWKTLPNSGDESFTDLYTIGGNDLLRTFYACIPANSISEDFITHFEDVRVKRNKIVHSIGGEEISPEDVLKLILWTFTFLLGPDSFWESVLDKFYNHPGHEVGDEELEFEEIQQYIHLVYLEGILGKGELNNHFKVDLKARRYYCPTCTAGGGVLVKGDDSVEEYPSGKWAFLSPNAPDSTGLECLVCRESFDIERKDCNPTEGEPCKGNVIYLDEPGETDEDTGEVYEEDSFICLTCMRDQHKDKHQVAIE